VLSWGRVLELTLATGALRRGTLTDFAALRAITAQRFANERAEVWPISLRFSSITDVQRARGGASVGSRAQANNGAVLLW
jgi:hypothetical protein